MLFRSERGPPGRGTGKAAAALEKAGLETPGRESPRECSSTREGPAKEMSNDCPSPLGFLAACVA